MTNAWLAMPELFLSVAGMLLLLFGALRNDKSAVSVSLLSLVAFVLTAVLLLYKPQEGLAFGAMYIADGFSRFVKLLLLLASGFSIALSGDLLRRAEGARSDYPVLILFATLGMMLMVSAHDLIALYVGLELQNLALYVLTAFRRDSARANEAGLKYFTLGALSSCVLLFGLSLLYGFAGTTSYAAFASLLSAGGAINSGLAVGLAFTVAGLAFKIAAVPFHMWSPDVYEGAPTPVTAFLASAPKIAAMALIVRLLIQSFGGMVEVWQPLVLFLAVVSLLLGSFAGLVQTNLKRLMAYSGIVNVGTLLVGLVAFQKDKLDVSGVEGLLLYLAVYLFGVLGVFAVMLSLREKGETVEKISDLAGLSKTHPFQAAALGACLFSLAGIPPLAGFFGKYLVLLAAVKSGLTALAILGVVASVVAAGYYLRLVKIMYFESSSSVRLEEALEKPTRFVVVITALMVTLFILIPAPLMEAARQAAESLVRS